MAVDRESTLLWAITGCKGAKKTAHPTDQKVHDTRRTAFRLLRSQACQVKKKSDNKVQGSGGSQGGRTKGLSKQAEGRKSSGNKKSGT